MSLFGTYISNDRNNSINTKDTINTDKLIENTDIHKEETIMNNYGIITNEDGSKTMIELSEAEMSAVMESREILDEEVVGGKWVAPADNRKVLQKAKGSIKKGLINTKMAASEAKTKAGLGLNRALINAKIKLNDIKKYGLKPEDMKKILIAVGGAVAAGVSITAIVAAIKAAKKKDSTNESVMFVDEDGNAEIIEITNEEYEALVEARLENDEDNVCRLTLTNEELEAIIDCREEM